MKKAIFLDRDGTLIKEVNYLTKKSDIEILPGVKDALSLFKKLGFLNIVISNQSAVARGYISEKNLQGIHSFLYQSFKIKNHHLLDDIYFSPFHKEGIINKYKVESILRKPAPGMILKAVFRHNIDLNNSFLIGDSLVDMQCAQYTGVRKILVLTGYGRKTLMKCKTKRVKIDFVAKNLLDASKFIKKCLEY